MVSIVKNDEFTENNFLSKKHGPSSFKRKFIVSNGNLLNAMINVVPGKKIEYDFTYEGDYSYEEAAKTNGDNFKEDIEEAIPSCKCDFKESHELGDEEMSEGSNLDLSCKCSSGIDGKFTKSAFSVASKEVDYIASTMDDRAFKYERTAF